MQKIDGSWVISPQDLVSEYQCEHKLTLDASVASGALERPTGVDAGLDLLRRQGNAHERLLLERCEAAGEVARLDLLEGDYVSLTQATLAALEAEVPVVYQATLFTGDFVGIADFLVLAFDEDGSVLRGPDGRAVYEPVDAKSARSAKTTAVLQVAAYADALIRLGRPAPVSVHLWLAGDVAWSAPAASYLPLAREYRQRVMGRLSSLGALPSPLWAAPVSACAQCAWKDSCASGRAEARDVSLVQGMTVKARDALVRAGISTIDDLASAGDRPSAVSQGMFDKLSAQAGLQVQAEQAGHVLTQVVDPEPIALLPAPSPLDLWLDFEGDPYALSGRGLEYMIGYAYLEADGSPGYASLEAHDAAGECEAFEAFIDVVMARLERDPHMHVYHYADYERAALLRLSQRYSTREAALDVILSSGVLVDLYRTVRKSLRVSTPGLSLKQVEVAYGVTHKGGQVASAMDSVVEYERAIALRAEGDAAGAAEVLGGIRAYNALDCSSTMQLGSWLRSLVPASDAPSGAGVDVVTVEPVDTLVQALLAGVPADEADRTLEQSQRAMLAGVLGYHRREERVAWWSFFDAVKTDSEELPASSKAVHVTSCRAEPWVLPTGRERKSRRELTVRTSQDPRDVFKGVSSVHAVYADAPPGTQTLADSPRGTSRLSVVDIGDDWVTLKELGDFSYPDAPLALVPDATVSAKPIEQALRAAAIDLVPQAPGGAWHFEPVAWADLLLARTPRVKAPLPPASGDMVVDVLAAVRSLDDSFWAIQGPPGTGKTYVGSHVVADLARHGWRIGVVAQSHAVVENFLDKVCEVDASLTVAKSRSPKDKEAGKVRRPYHIDGKVSEFANGASGGFVVGGTAWTFTDAAMPVLDLLVIDEAGQFALANAIACALTARNVLLLGDPQQLPQVSQASHPEGVEVAVLERVMGGSAVIHPSRGSFLAQSRRMHPDLTEVVSRLSYEGKLAAHPSTLERSLEGVPAGVTAVPVMHEGNTTRSVEEAAEVVRLVRSVVGSPWTDAGVTRPLVEDDVIVVAAYNAQVGAISRALQAADLHGVHVGTVDRFQGREAAVAIVSMAASSADDLPRGLEFLLMPNRVNVAISRAQWASFVLYSPQLLAASPSSLEAMATLGGFLGMLGR